MSILYHPVAMGCDNLHTSYQIAIIGPNCSPRIYNTNSEKERDMVLCCLPRFSRHDSFQEAIEFYKQKIREIEEAQK